MSFRSYLKKEWMTVFGVLWVGGLAYWTRTTVFSPILGFVCGVLFTQIYAGYIIDSLLKDLGDLIQFTHSMADKMREEIKAAFARAGVEIEWHELKK